MNGKDIALIKAIGGGGSGGSGLPSGGTPYQQLVTGGNGNTQWEDRLAYETDPVETILIPEQVLDFSHQEGTMYIATSDFNKELIVGEQYTVNFDGIEYRCTAKQIQDRVFIGNASILGGENTGEPFIYINLGGAYVFASPNNGNHTISLSVLASENVPISKKFLTNAVCVVKDPRQWTADEAEYYCKEFGTGTVLITEYDAGTSKNPRKINCVILALGPNGDRLTEATIIVDGVIKRLIPGIYEE